MQLSLVQRLRPRVYILNLKVISGGSALSGHLCTMKMKIKICEYLQRPRNITDYTPLPQAILEIFSLESQATIIQYLVFFGFNEHDQ